MRNIFIFLLAGFLIINLNPLYSQDVYELKRQDRMPYGASYAVGIGDKTIAYGDGAILKIFEMSESDDPLLVSETEIHSAIDDIVIVGDYLYLAVIEVGVMMFDISDPSSPVLHKSFPSYAYDLQIEVLGAYVYLSDSYGTLKVIDIEDPSGPKLVTELDVLYRARELILRGDILIATVYDNTFFFDVSNPMLPIALVNIKGKSFYDGEIVGQKLYLTDQDTLHIYNIADISDPKLEAKFNSEGTRLVRIEIEGDYLYGVSTDGKYTIYEIAANNIFNMVGELIDEGYSIDLKVVDGKSYVIGVRKGLVMINNEDKFNPFIEFADENGSFVVGLDIKGDICYIANEYDGFQIYEIDGDNNFVKAGRVTYSGEAAYQIEVEGNFAYVARKFEGLSIIDVSDIYSPFEVSSLAFNGSTNDIAVRGNLLYLTQKNKGLIVVDISNPYNPVEIGSFAIQGEVHNLDVQDSFAYIANGIQGLYIIDVTDPTNPQLASIYNDDSSAGILVKVARDVMVENNAAYLADLGNGFHIIDVTDKYNPLQISNEKDYGSIRSIHVKEDIVYLGRYNDGVSIIDISDPENIRELDTYDTGGRVEDIALSGNHILASDFNCGFYLFNILVTTSTHNTKGKNDSHIKVYPNPTSENLSIEIELGSTSSVDISIMDVNGHVSGSLYKGKLSEGVQTIEFGNELLNEFTTGFYVIKVNIGNEQVAMPVFIQH